MEREEPEEPERTLRKESIAKAVILRVVEKALYFKTQVAILCEIQPAIHDRGLELLEEWPIGVKPET